MFGIMSSLSQGPNFVYSSHANGGQIYKSMTVLTDYVLALTHHDVMNLNICNDIIAACPHGQ